MLIDFSTAALPHAGDTNAFGGGLTTSSVTNETDLQVYGQDAYLGEGGYGIDDGGSIHPMLEPMLDSPAGHPVVWWFALAGGVVLWCWWDDDKGFGILTDIGKTTLKVVVGITLAKMFFGTVKIPGLSELVEAA
jgi:hypothetical protein